MMELIEICDGGGLIPISSSPNLIVQPSYNSYVPSYHYINDVGGIQLIQEASINSDPSYVQVIDPSPQPAVVNYVCNADGTLVPVYDSFPLDSAPYFITAEQEDSDPGIPSHVLDHMYAKKPKEPGSGPTSKPRKRVKKPKVQCKTSEYKDPEIASNTPKVNIIRKGQVTPPTVVRQIAARPKILQAKSVNVPKSAPGVSGIGNVVSLTDPVSTPSTPPKPPPVDRWTSRRRNAANATIALTTNSFSTLDSGQNEESFYLSPITRDAIAGAGEPESMDTSVTQFSVNDPQLANYCIMLPPGQELGGISGDNPNQMFQLSPKDTLALSQSGTLQSISLPNNIYFSLT